MKKQFINEAKRFQELAGIRQLNENDSTYFKTIWDMYSDDARENASYYYNDDDDIKKIQDAIGHNMGYSTMDELISSIFNVEAEFEESDFGGLAIQLNNICKEINYPNRLEFLKALHDNEADIQDYDEEDRTHAWEYFLGEIGEKEAISNY
jgi:hypothetical protein